MTQFKNSKHNKDGPERDNFLTAPYTPYKNDYAERPVKKAFTAWPDEPKTVKNTDVKILEGRTKNGGYVAYPKKKKVR